MISISALNYIHKTGLFGNHERKNEENLLKVSEIKNMLIVQIVQNRRETNEQVLIGDGILGYLND